VVGTYFTTVTATFSPGMLPPRVMVEPTRATVFLVAGFLADSDGEDAALALSADLSV